MTSATLTRRQPVRRPMNRWLIALGVVVVVAVAAFGLSRVLAPSAPATASTVVVARGNIVAAVSGSGSIDAAQSLDLPFATSGTVTEVLVGVGDSVVAGQPLARLDDRLLQVQLTSAQAGLSSAQARLLQAQQGDARPEDIAAAQAQLAQAQANYNKLGAAPDAAQLSSARTAVSSAQAAYASALAASGTTDTQVAAAQAALDKAAVALKVAQQNYDRVASQPAGQVSNQAQSLANAQADYQSAQASYSSQLATLAPSAQSKLLSAAAQLASARANLDKLLNPATPAELAAGQAGVDAAQAGLDKLTAPATGNDLAIAQAAVTQAQQSVAQAQLNLDNATLRAPFAGVVAAVNVVPGGSAGTGQAAVSLIDRSALHVDLKLSETDATGVRSGQPVTLTVDSLGGQSYNGTVTFVSPAAQVTNNVVTYAVRVDFLDNPNDVKVGMTANLSIVTAEKDNVLLVPNTALLPKGSGHVVRVVEGKQQREVEVQTGLTDGTRTEITGGLNGGEAIVALPSNGTTTRTTGGPGGGFPGGGLP